MKENTPSSPPAIHTSPCSPRRWHFRAAWLALAAAGTLAASSCRVDQQEFNNRVFSCNVAAPDPGCGTDETGQAMSCFATRQLGAADFCAKTCEPPPATEDRSESPMDVAAVCLQSGISLTTCLPSHDVPKADPPQHACSQAGMACYRTDLIEDDGVCTTMNPCTEDMDCKDPVRSVCAATFLASLYSKADAVMRRDHMYCLQTGCKALGTSCSPGETCLQDVIPASAHPPDICVPNCDSMRHCPPNYLCYRGVSTAVTPNVCIPGLLGFTCVNSIDCMFGRCIDNGIGYKVCTRSCETEADCEQFDGVQGNFLCIKNLGNPTDPGNCQTPNAYRGSLCDKTEDCIPRNPEEVCTRVNPTDAQGSCLLPCGADGDCAPRGGINHTCLKPPLVASDENGVCYPGYFGYPCASNGNCLTGLTCQATVPDSPSICSQHCATTDDCKANRWIGGDGWCHPQLGICLSKGDVDAACASDEACKSGRCSNNKCASPGGTP